MIRRMALVAAFGGALSGAAQAQSAGSFVANVGWFHFAPQDSSRPLEVTRPGQAAVTVPGTGATVSNADTVGITGTYFITDNIAAEAVFGYPPRFKLYGEGGLGKLGQLGSASEWSPTLLLKYYFGQAGSRFRPYVGAGASYVWYGNVKLNAAMANGSFLAPGAAQGVVAVGPTSADLTSSVAPVVNAGLAYNINDRWSISASVSYMWLSTRATLTTRLPNGAQITSQTRLKIDPIITFVSLGYRF
ncbi:OmpW/AlkL family protein [Chitinasiproducens palmae]|uniref:Outer membrane protein n=1 Tax=Chitinasiproducens palmae TaxID=1770053 RepID=A0A1H2PNP6_9BURK|nr:OmpW family outer membrane protein [Chitinasiproducens palmae]SDV48277.1 outer membrane protein [Chitinasiproducens palmae]